MSPLGVVLAEAEPAEVITVAAAWISMPVALAGSAATGACRIAKTARPAPFTMFPPRPIVALITEAGSPPAAVAVKVAATVPRATWGRGSWGRCGWGQIRGPAEVTHTSEVWGATAHTMPTVFQARAVTVCDAITLVAALAVTLIAERRVQAGCPWVTPRQAQAAFVHIWTAGIGPAGRESHRQSQALSHPQGAVPPTQGAREVPLKAPSQSGVVFVATPATLVALQTLVTGQEAAAAPAPRL